ncbi:ATP-binding cassette domain-containing protein [Desulfonatronovibrio hydrogenovorans]|uniref:ATP-binding cassette domain-containing protein n=1 Tax=Desulfonatronovibrio hydrogenovorans TaxID=53245 RepID=UPI001237722E|nr:ATP-binding cassette domain-containing protein [Desulfonatronovibrio hydrogenovorans]
MLPYSQMNRTSIPSPAIVELKAVHKSFTRGLFQKQVHRVLGPVELAVHPGRVVGLFGPSGSGKSTLGNIILNLTRPDSGQVFWNGHDLNDLSLTQKNGLRPRFQKIFQDPALTFAPFQSLDRSFQDVIRFLYPDSQEQARSKLASLMQSMNLGMELLTRTPDKVSGGEIQRLALIRCLLADPLFLVADEPTSRLDPLVQAQVARTIQAQGPDKGMGVLFISHDFALLKALCHEVFKLENGILSRMWLRE